MKHTKFVILTVSILTPFAAIADSQLLDPVVVTVPLMSEPLTVETDPKAPRQPVPATDGADFLKNIPGFSTVRKGGTSGEAVLRGLTGSRLNILQNGADVLGGCPGRMDPPTAYLYPQSFDKVTVIKGPQTVRYGGGNLAGTVLFERQTERFSAAEERLFASTLIGSYGRNDQVFDAAAGIESGFLRLIGTRSEADDYEDGDGTKVHSQFERWSGTAIAGWTPTKDTRLELTMDLSDGEAAYADRAMDGTQFDRTGYSIKLAQDNLSPLLQRVEAQAYYQYVDHVMDNFRLRQPPMMNMVMNPDRTSQGARLMADLSLTNDLTLTLGADYKDDEHSGRMASSPQPTLPTLGARNSDFSASQVGVYTELGLYTGSSHWLAGVRADRVKATVEAATFGGAVLGDDDQDTNVAGFARYEYQVNSSLLAFAGLGRAARSPDYWERRASFDTKPEHSNQIDLGLGYRLDTVELNLSAFYARIDDYILIDWANVGGNWLATGARNIDATTMGLEADAAWAFADNWRISATLAHVYGKNRSDDRALAQIPPLEARLALDYDKQNWLAGVLLRGVARQTRVSIDSGSIAGRDLGTSSGFAVLSMHAGYRPTAKIKLTAGIDNLFDLTYAEHLSRSGSDAVIIGYDALPQVNEPGRTFWLQVSANF